MEINIIMIYWAMPIAELLEQSILCKTILPVLKFWTTQQKSATGPVAPTAVNS